MAGALTLLKGLPRYEVFLEEAKCFPGLDASACYTYLQLLRTGDELLALDEQVLNSHGTRHGRFNLMMMLLKYSDGEATPAGLAEKTGVTRATIVEPLNEEERQQLVILLEKIRTRLSELELDVFGEQRSA
jgi:hypothetical protein